MSDVILLGTDTDVGKTTLALLWLHRFADRYEYWKPVETGESDSARIVQLAPLAVVHSSVRRLKHPVAPPLAARLAGETIPLAADLASARPQPLQPGRSLLIETFGGPFSPLNETELQVSLLRRLGGRCVLVSSTTLGCIGRTLQALTALRGEGIDVAAVVVLGPLDRYAEEVIGGHCGQAVVAIEPPTAWNAASIGAHASTQAVALDRLHAAMTPASRNADLIRADDRRIVWHPYTPLSGTDDPLVCVGAQDEFLELADGRRVIDSISSWWTILHGHRHRPLMAALTEASRQFDHVMFAGVTHPAAVELAELLLGTMPWVGGRVFYSDNGSTAVEVALKMAYQHWCQRGEPGRTRFVGFEHGYHGDTFGAMAVSRDPVFFGRFEPLLFQADIVPLDPERLDTHLGAHAGEVAAVILEPLVQGAGGMRMHPPETLRQLVEVTHRHGVLFIADEVMTGGGRTGTFWAHQAAGVHPDLVCAAKTLTGGMLPLAATLVAPEIVASFCTPDRSRTFFHGHSFTAHPLACAVAACNLRLTLGSSLDAPRRMERFWTEALGPLGQDPRVQAVRIRGSIAAVELAVEGGYLAEIAPRLRRVCLEHGVLLRPLGSVLYALPPYCTSAASLERIAAAMTAAVRAI